MRHLRQLSPLLFLVTAAVLNAQALRFNTTPTTVAGSWSPDADVAADSSLTVQCRNWATSWFVTFSAGQSGTFASRRASGGGRSITYQIHDDAVTRTVLKDLSANPAAAEVLSGSFAKSSAWAYQSRSFTVLVPAGQLPVPGTYTDTITLQLYPGTPSNPGSRQASRTMTISIVVAAAIDISLVPVGAAFDPASRAQAFDFGTLAAGARREADVMARSNTGWSLTVTSLNAGKLKPGGIDDDAIAYRLLAGGLAVNLSSGASQSIATGAPASTIAGTRIRIEAIVDDLPWATEGTYGDVLTFVVTAK